MQPSIASQPMQAYANFTPQPDEPIGPWSRPLFVRYIARGCKPRERWTIGPELELLGYERDSLERISPETVDAVLAEFASLGAEPVFEDGRRIEARAESWWLTVEPGGQIEFSGAGRSSLEEAERNVELFLSHLAEVAERQKLLFLASGFDPLRTADEQRWYPKRRYAVMRPYFAVDGRQGWDMMCRTASIQVNVDYGSAEDLAKKFLVGNRMGPIVAAIFANSPFEAGALSGFKSRRVAAWLETDRDRTGVSPASIDDDFTIERFVDYLVEVPMLFVRRDGGYVDLAGSSFVRYLEEGAGEVRPAFCDFVDHATTVFTEARLKQHVELRSADAGPLSTMLALQALWKGLLYDDAALDAAFALGPRLDRPAFSRLLGAIARDGLGATAEGVRVLDVAREAIRLATAGLGRVAADEARYLEPVADRVLTDGLCPADLLVRDFERTGSIARAVEAMRVA
jgi:glutamate--cysteine ligase